ncbi:UNKNOWN [Stylonychia lemnae]|uniref:Transmembrane protein n=1 Tax=Stylonychia lemnae TaxID=5949 RepID=A0A078AD68_STYLE|nr:UNKNOWN [Stylonychia lemnae]|eukprot:CDW78813.1 UNKNOWN [Stylonychia lemnae]
MVSKLLQILAHLQWREVQSKIFKVREQPTFQYQDLNSEGGVFNLINSNITLQKSIITSSFGHFGGGLFLSCSNSVNCFADLKNNTFSNNTAHDQGGAIDYNKNKPLNLDSNSFLNNSAPYGNDIASKPYTLLEFTKTLAESGEQYPYKIVLEILDYQLQRVTNDQSLQVEIEELLINRTVKLTEVNQTLNSVIGENLKKAVEGVVTLDNIHFIGTPGSKNALFKIFSPSINTEYMKAIYHIPDKTQINEVIIELDFDTCSEGQIETNLICYPCATGTYNLFRDQQQCHDCLPHADCLGGNRLSIVNGFWRSSNVSTQIHECLNPDACIGGLMLNDSEVNPLCQQGYGGNLCHTCQKINGVQYSRTKKDICEVCPESRLDWPKPLDQFFQSFSYVGASIQNLLYFECIFDDQGIKNKSNSLIFLQTLIIGLLPLMLMVIFSLGFILYIIISRINASKFIDWFAIMAICVIYFTHPTLSRAVMSIFICMEINQGEYWLVSDLSVQCWTGDHLTLSLLVGLPFGIFWIILVPFLGFCYLYKKKEYLTNKYFKDRFKILCSGLKQEYYYWEFFNISRKIGLVFINVFLQTQLPLFKSMVGLLFLGGIYRLQERYQPYENPMINELEKREMISIFISFYFSLYFLNKEFQKWAQLSALVIIIMFNAWFMILWFYLVLIQFKYTFTYKLANKIRHFTLLKIEPINIGIRMKVDSMQLFDKMADQFQGQIKNQTLMTQNEDNSLRSVKKLVQKHSKRTSQQQQKVNISFVQRKNKIQIKDKNQLDSKISVDLEDIFSIQNSNYSKRYKEFSGYNVSSSHKDFRLDSSKIPALQDMSIRSFDISEEILYKPKSQSKRSKSKFTKNRKKRKQ